MVFLELFYESVAPNRLGKTEILEKLQICLLSYKPLITIIECDMTNKSKGKHGHNKTGANAIFWHKTKGYWDCSYFIRCVKSHAFFLSSFLSCVFVCVFDLLSFSIYYVCGWCPCSGQAFETLEPWPMWRDNSVSSEWKTHMLHCKGSVRRERND